MYLCFFERNVLYPLMVVSVLTQDAPKVAEKYGTLLGMITSKFRLNKVKQICMRFFVGSLISVVCGMKMLRNSYSDQNCQYLIVTFTALVCKFDCRHLDETFLVTYFFVSIAYYKIYEFLLKVSRN